MKTLARFAVVIAIAQFSFMLPQANAGVITIVGDTADGSIDVNGIPANSSDQFTRVGTGGDIIRGVNIIYFFELPTLSSLTTITDAELRFEYVGKRDTPEFNIDLFGIDARPDAHIEASDYYDGIATSSSDSLIQIEIITPSTSFGNLSVGNSNLLNFVNSLYNVNGTPVSSFATFRVNPDKDLPENSGPIRGYYLALADHTTESFRPRLELTTTVAPNPDPNLPPSPCSASVPSACLSTAGDGSGSWPSDTSLGDKPHGHPPKFSTVLNRSALNRYAK